MLFLVIVVIALGWLAFAASWARDRTKATPNLGFIADPYLARKASPFDAPRTEVAARTRRQQVFSFLIVAAVLTFFMTRLWSIMWGLHLLADVALVVFGAAWFLRSSDRPLIGEGTWRTAGFNQPVREPVVAAPVAHGWVNSISRH